MIEPSTIMEYGVTGFAVGCIVGICKWFLGALDKKDSLIGDIVTKHEDQREKESERHDKSFNRLSDAINDLTKEIARKKD
jgi:hypothetical protein